MTTTYVRRIAVRGIIERDGSILCVKLSDYKHKPDYEKFWCLPGGGVEDNESLVDALNREIVEELGVEPDIGALLYVQQFSWLGLEQMEFFFHIRNAEAYEALDISQTSHGAEELSDVRFINPPHRN